MFTKRHGHSWLEREIKQLRKEYNKGWTVTQIAEKHQRSNLAIEYALLKFIGEVDTSKDIIINGVNYSRLLEMVRKMIFLKVDIDCQLHKKPK